MSLIEKALGKARAATLEAAPHAPPQAMPQSMPQGMPQAVPQAAPQVDTGATTARQRALQMPPSRMAIDPDVRITDSMLEQLGLRASAEQDYQRISEFRHIKRNLLAAIRARETNRVILVASALSGEGKSFSAANLARTLALEPDYVVLLVDADVAKPHITNALDLLERKGLMDALTEPGLDVESLILTTDFEGLSILPAGGSHEHATEHLASERMRAVVELLQEVPNRIIVIDSLPILLTTEARVLAPLAGQVLMVVRAESTPQQSVEQAVEILGDGVNIKMILNAVVKTRASKYLGYGYGYEYGYGATNSKRSDLK
jgi:receptor protein-tyrosine kinase